FEPNDGSPFQQRWGGWYVTGRSSSKPHLGNTIFSAASKPSASKPPPLESLATKFDTSAYLAPYSHIVALLVFEHQMHVLNLLTRVGLDVRSGNPHNVTALIHDGAAAIADALLFTGAARLTG